MSLGPAGSERWRVRPAGRAGAVLVVLVWTALAVGISAGGASVGVATTIWCCVPILAACAWRWAFVPYVALEPGVLLVQNRLGRCHRIAYTDVAMINAGYYGLTIRRHSGPRVVAWAVQKSNVASWTHKPTRADAIADTIRARIGKVA